MTPELLAHLSPEQREAWERCQILGREDWHTAGECEEIVVESDAIYGVQVADCGKPDGDEYQPTPEEKRNRAAFIAHARQDLPAALLELAQTKAELVGLRAAVDAAPHGKRCEKGGWYTKPIPAALHSPQQVADWLTDLGNRVYYDCTCWKSRLPK